ncbi:uncharacterized protein LOC120752084 [Hirundo rustica]|uniref:uncharacterized protein LOC120752084 n=1 Tax=Hirundo rustica TaxID=43150 RepID=UPI001A950389|nr:uncharacterized protein LOC120752084 [Hirundo rustica]
MGGGGGRGPARTQPGRLLRAETARLAASPARGAPDAERVSGDPASELPSIQRRDPRREITSRRSGGGTSPPPRRPACPRLLSTGSRRRRQPEKVVSFYRKGEPAYAPLPRLGQASPAGTSEREEIVGENRARKGKNPFHDQGRRQPCFYSPAKRLLLEIIFTLFLKSMPSLLVFAGDVTYRMRCGRREHELSGDSRDLLQKSQLGHL